MTYEEIADTLAKMQRYILEHGWTQGYYEDRKGRVCFVGAFSKIAAKKDFDGRIDFWAFIGRELGSPVCFNDLESTTEQNVLDKMHELELKAKGLAASGREKA